MKEEKPFHAKGTGGGKGRTLSPLVAKNCDSCKQETTRYLTYMYMYVPEHEAVNDKNTASNDQQSISQREERKRGTKE